MINFQDNSDQYSLEQYDDSNVYYDEFQEHPAKDYNENSHIITTSRTNHSQSSQEGSYTIIIHRISHDIMEKHKFNKHISCY